jgi:hypothetical protein
MEVLPSHPLNQLTAIYVPKTTIGDGSRGGGAEKSLLDLFGETVLFGCNSVFSHLVPDGHAGDTQNFRGLRLIAPGLFKRFDQPAFFFVVSGYLGTDSGWRWCWRPDNVRRKVPGLNHEPLTGDEGIFERALEFPDVSRPGLGHQQMHGVFGDAVDFFIAFELNAAEEMFGQQWNVADPLP